MNNQMIGKVLQGRYQIVQSLGAGVFGQTYVALDIHYPGKPRCVIKQLKVNNYQSTSYFDEMRLRFLSETQTLQYLGTHNQIPELITCFEENERFYLVQEYIPGHALTAELPMSQQWGHQWSESEVITLLEDALEIIGFVHSQGFIHCDVKPENLIRRAADGKLVLIDFGSIQPIDFSSDTELPISQIPVTSLGYIPPEQFIGQSKPNSDIYALGIIAIQALTGLAPLQLQIDAVSNEIVWRHDHISVSDYLASILSQMIRYNYQDRFQSAHEVLRVIKQMKMENQPGKNIATAASIEDEQNKPSPLLAGLQIGLIINGILIGLGAYSLVNSSPSPSETDVFYQAVQKSQAGDLKQAINLAKSIPADSNVYPEAQASIAEWQEQLQADTEKYLIAEEDLQQGKWSHALRTVPQVPDTAYWQEKTDKLVNKAEADLEAKATALLNKAYAKAENRDFTAALAYLQQIPKESYAGEIVQKKLAEYNQKKQIRSGYFLNKAYRQAAVGDFDGALKLLRKIPKDSEVYAQAQVKVREYTQKLSLREQAQKANQEKIIAARQKNRYQSFNWDSEPGNSLQEVNIRF
ncbi:MAG TPA: serine/threonine-protein kinase [Nostocaceae cyanobacterium]|nr:serine/threonine-protein kinase [Nostocaceae cyanobacterium]